MANDGSGDCARGEFIEDTVDLIERKISNDAWICERHGHSDFVGFYMQHRASRNTESLFLSPPCCCALHTLRLDQANSDDS